MELRTYLTIILRYWWLVLLCVILGAAAMAVLDRMSTPLYRTQARMVVRPSSSLTDPRLTIDSVATLGSRYVAGTFAQTVTAAQVRDEARRTAGLTAEQANDYDIEANVLPDTAVIQISGTGPNPTTVSTYLNATVQSAVQNTRALFGVMELAALEQARVPTNPISPVPARDIPLGAGGGLAVGILLALSLAYLRVQQAAARGRRTAPVPAGVPGSPLHDV